MKNKKIIAVILLIIGVGLIGTGVYFNLFSKDNKKKEKNSEILLTTKLLKDYEEGKITTDEYVRYNLYAEYDDSLLGDEYSSFEKDESAIHTSELIDKYFDELSDETKKYYVENISLKGVTFELNKENEEEIEEDDSLGLADFFVEDVYAKTDKATNLNKAVLSSEGNFVVWYTTTGTSAITKEEAEKVAADLEKTREEYDKLSSNKFEFEGNILSEGKQHKNKIKILESLGIDTDYLIDALQVYIVEYKDTSAAKFIQLPSLWERFWGDFIGTTDPYGVTVYPYILIRPSSFENYENVAQLYNHEFFHYYQHNVLCGRNDCTSDMVDIYSVEATANWASSLATTKTTDKGYLNEWAVTAFNFSSNLMSDEWAEKYGIDKVGYALFVYFYNYSNIVEDGTNKIIESIYKEDSLKYLQENATMEELAKIQEEMAYKHLKQDYVNKNLIIDPEYGAKLDLQQTITKDTNIKNKELNKIGIDYYLLDVNSNKQQFKISLNRNTEDVNVTVIGLKDKNYTLLETSNIDKNEYVFNTNAYGEYDKLYIAVTNSSLVKINKYSLSIQKTDKIDVPEISDKEEDNTYETKFKNYKLKANSTIEVYGYATTTVTEGVVDELHQKEYLKSTTETMGIEIVTETYSDFAKGITYTSVPFTSDWEKTTGASSFVDLTTIMDKLEDAGTTTKISENEYKIKLSSEDVQGLMDSSNSTGSSTIKGDIYVHVFVEGDYVTKLEYDFSGLIEGIDKFTMIIEFSDFNIAGDVEIPKSITK